MVVASVALAISVSLVFATATVYAGAGFGRAQCGTVVEPNAETSECASALKARSKVTAGLLGLASFGALWPVLVTGGSPARRRRRVAIATVCLVLVTVAAAVLRDGVIDRTVGA